MSESETRPESESAAETAAETENETVTETAPEAASEPATGRCPFSGADAGGLVDSAALHAALRRRSFLRGAAVGAAGAAAVAAGVAGAAVAAADDSSATTGSGRVIPFHGAHQAGILTPPQNAATFVSFDVDRRRTAPS